MLLLDNVEHNRDHDPWPWGGEPIYRDDQLVGTVTTTSYGFSLKKHVALGFVHNYSEPVTADWVKRGEYEMEIAGIRYPCKVRLSAPILPTKVSEGTKAYEATRHDM